MLENDTDYPDQRVNFTGDPQYSHPINPNPHEQQQFNQSNWQNNHHPNYLCHHDGNGCTNHDQHFNQYQHMNGGDSGYGHNHPMPRPGQKRGWHHSSMVCSPDQVEGGCHVKVYVAPVPRTATEVDVRLVFEGHGTIVEVVLLKDKRTGARQGSCFVKYATLDEADRAIKALSNQYTFPGESSPIVVRYADRDLERLGVRGFCRNMEKKDPLEEVANKVFVGYINREASKMEIEEVFSPYGHVEDIFIAHSRGYGFVKFSNREMALAAINGLNGTFTMRGCDHPLIVRFADPKKPKTGESRGNHSSGIANFRPCFQEPAVRPLPNFGNPNMGGSIPPIAPHHSTIPPQQVASHMQNWEPGAAVVQQPFPPQQAHSQLASMPFPLIQAPQVSSQPPDSEVLRQPHPVDLSAQNIEKLLNSQISGKLSTETGSNPHTVAGSTSPDMPASPQAEDFPVCDWSEHYCPDGHKYFYNCVTCESRWEKPEEYALYEKESHTKQEQEDQNCLSSQLSLSSSQQVAQRQQLPETNHDQGWSSTNPVVAQV